MNKPATLTFPISDQLWCRIMEVAAPEDEDELIKFVIGAIEEYRASWDYDSPRD